FHSESRYDVSVTNSEWPSTVYYDTLFETYGSIITEMTVSMAQSDEERRSILAREFTKVNIFLETFEVTNIGEDAKYDLSKTMSDLGGAAGLYLGICVVTLLEILELILSLCKSLIRFLFCRSSGKMQNKNVHPMARGKSNFPSSEMYD
ncbi:unnamed protein product, partial [Notodromas monacha]